MTNAMSSAFRFLAIAGVAALWLPLAALAETRRVAIVVGNNAGSALEKPLHYAEEDATKVADVLAQLGDVHEGDLLLLKGRGRKELQEALARAAKLVAGYRQAPEDRTVVLFYYSGHSDGDALELGADRVFYPELLAWLRETSADVRVLIVDGCKSGSLVQSKGATRGPAFEIKLSDQLDATGEVILTSSAADELALESREIRGSFFTHHLVSGLRGAADVSGDGRITLAEAYQYAFSHTLAATSIAGVRQHPGYEYRLAGKGELILTEIAKPSASLELPADFERALIVLVRRDQVLAELTSDAARRVALAPGEYAVRVWKGTRAYVARVTVASGDAKKVTWAGLQPVSSPPVARKGRGEDLQPEGVDALTPEARAEYDAKYLVVGDEMLVVVAHNQASLQDTYSIYQGKYRKKLDEDKFFEIAGRNDLSGSYNQRRALRYVLFAAGGATLLGGVVYAIFPRTCGVGPGDPRFSSECFKTDQYLIGGILAAGGLAALLGGFLINEHPVAPHEVRRIADEYNGRLLRRLEGAPPAPPQPSVRWEVTPFNSPRGGGLLLTGAF